MTGTRLIININGANPYIIELGSGYVEYGATRTDAIDGSGDITGTGIVSTVNTGVLST